MLGQGSCLVRSIQVGCTCANETQAKPVGINGTRQEPRASRGEYVTIARKDRNSENWYIGSSTNEQPHNFKIALDFLTHGEKYIAQIYADGKNADYKTNPTDIIIKEIKVTSKSVLDVRLAAAGGQAIRIVKK